MYKVEFSAQNTGYDEKYYPGTLNKDGKGNDILSQDSADLDSFENSAKAQRTKMNVKLPSEIGSKFPNPAFGPDIVPGNTTDPSYNILPLLQRLAGHAEDEDFEGSLKEPAENIDPRAFLPDLNALALVGDPRWSLGSALQAMTQKFQPRIEAYTAVLEQGATTITDGYFCTDDGTKIAVAPDDVVRSFAGPPTIEEIIEEFVNLRDKANLNHAEAFVRYLKRNYLDKEWFAEAVFINPPGFFFIKVTHYRQPKQKLDPDDFHYFRYYSDMKDIVIGLLGISLEQKNHLAVFNPTTVSEHNSSNNTTPDQSNARQAKALSELMQNIPDYTKMV